MTSAHRTTLLLLSPVLPVLIVGALALGPLAEHLPLTGAAGSTTGVAARGLDPDLADRLADARDAAARDGVDLVLTSGWRSAAHQRRLFEEAVVEHGSREEASRWVLPPEDSAHVDGLAVDVGPPEGRAWLEAYGAEFGLCRVYENEPWHFEPLVERGGTCPGLRPDGSVDVGR